MVQETSKTAYHEEILPTLGERQAKVFNAIAERDNVTNTELAEILGWPINTVTPRTNELVVKRKVIEACKRTCAVTGRRVIAWRIRRDTLF